MIDLDQVWCLDPQKIHTVGEPRAVRSNHVEPPHAACADVGFMRLDLEAVRSKPLYNLRWISPCLEGSLAISVNDTCDDNFLV